MTARLLLIALDGADSAMIDRLSAQGSLPHLAALRARGSTARLAAPAGVTDDALWASFQFGTGMGDHGRYHWRQKLADGSWGREVVRRPSFWNTLSDAGLRVGVFDVPKCGAPLPINGLHLTDWLVHGRYYRKPLSQPEALAGEVVARFGPPPPSRCEEPPHPLADAEVAEISANLHQSIAQKRRAAVHYLASEPWDLFIVGFKEAHCASHSLWHLSDARHPDYDAAQSRRLGDPIGEILVALDAAIGELVATGGPDAGVVAFSTTEYRPNVSLDHLMPGIAEAINRRLGATRPERIRWRFVPRRWRPAPRQVCQVLPYNENAVALRISGEAPERRQLLARVGALLEDLRDADSGLPVVAGINRPSSDYPGARAAGLPDLLVLPAGNAAPRAVVSSSLGRIAAKPPPIRAGNHAPGGFAVLAGAALPVQALARMEDFAGFAAEVLNVAGRGTESRS